MPLAKQTIVSLLNGISQQPASLRHPSQAEAQVNCLSSLSVGLEKRPPSEHVAKIQVTPIPSEGHFWHTINRSSTQQYQISVENGDVRVFDMSTGAEKTVNFTENRFFSLDDSVATDTGLNRRIYIPVGTTTADFATTGIVTATVLWEESTDGLFAGEETTVRTDTTDTDAAVTVVGGRWYRARVSAWTSGTIDAWIDWGDTSYLVSTDPKTHFRAISVADYTFIGNNQITVAMDTSALEPNGEVITDTVQVFGDLPAPMPGAAKIYHVSGDVNNDFDGYYVKVDAANKVYEEYKKPGATDTLDQATMPHTLVDNLDGTFTFGNGSWNGRDVGDETETNKNPPFVGQKINEVFFFRNRFGVCAGESVSLSRIGTAVGGYFNFFRETVTSVLATDPIHMEAPSEKNSKFIAAVPFDESLVLFSEEAQFVLNSEGTLTPASARIDVSTEFTASGNARPVGVGQNVYFPVDGGDHVGIREYFVEADTRTNDAANVTAHIPRYIPTAPIKLAGSTNEDMLAVLTSGNQQRIYVYKFFWDGQTKAQSSWSFWEMSTEDTIRNIDFIGPVLFLTIERSDGMYLEKISLNDDDAQDDINVKVHLDRRQQLTGVYNATSNITTWTFASATAIADSRRVVTGSAFATEGEVPTLTATGGSIIDAQDETSYDGSPATEGSFTGGTGHAATDVLTMSDGTTITVDTVSSGVVTEFTILVPASASNVAGTQLTQSASDAAGIDFTLTPLADNIEKITTTITAVGDWSTGVCWSGTNYTQSYTFSEQFQRADGETPDLSGRLQLRKWNVRFVNTGFFQARVSAAARATQVYTFSGAVLGDADFKLGDLVLYTGTFPFPVLAKSSLVTIQLINTTWKPATWLSSEWLALHSGQSVIQS